MTEIDPFISVIATLLRANSEERPIAICIAGSNGSGKSTFYTAALKPFLNLPFVNADEISKGLLSPASDARSLEAAMLAESQRKALVADRQSFIFETVFSDSEGQKVAFLLELQNAGYLVQLIFIGIQSSNVSQARVIDRVQRGGHDVPDDRITSRFPKTLENLRRAMAQIENILLVDNNQADKPFMPIMILQKGIAVWQTNDPLPLWVKRLDT